MEREFTLPAGYLDRDSELHKTVVLAPVTGRVRREIGLMENRRSGHAIITTILLHCVKSIGPHTKITKDLLDELLTGDRWFCAMMVRKFKGDMLKAEAQCTRCNETHLYEFSLDDYEIKTLNEDEYRISEMEGRSVRVFDISSQEMALDASFRYMNGADERVLGPLLRKNPFEAQYTLWSRCMNSWKLGEGDSTRLHKRDWDDLLEPVIEVVETEFNAAQPGPDTNHYELCPNCNVDIAVTLENSDFLFNLPGATKSRSSRT